MSRFYIQSCGLNVPIGSDVFQVSTALRNGTRAGLTSREDLLTGSPVFVGAIQGDLPPLAKGMEKFDCRNNRLMQTCLLQIASSIEAAIEKYCAHRIGVVVGTSTSGISSGEDALISRKQTGHWPADFDYRKQEISGLSNFVASYFKLTGPAYTVATACSSSAKVFASARRLMRAGLVDAVIVGGADTLCKMTLNGFNSLELLSKKPCNPFSSNRDGITIGEGASAFLLSVEEGSVELMGIGETSDAYHQTSPDPQGQGAQNAMRQALGEAGLAETDIQYINLHGTATRLNDAMEARAVSAVFGSETPCSSTKAMTGHMLGAAGGCEAGFLWTLLNPQTSSGFLPPHLWDGEYDSEIPKLNFVERESKISLRGPAAMLSNSFGFGGSNASLILGRRS